jgi:hypothetical protein
LLAAVLAAVNFESNVVGKTRLKLHKLSRRSQTTSFEDVSAFWAKSAAELFNAAVDAGAVAALAGYLGDYRSRWR